MCHVTITVVPLLRDPSHQRPTILRDHNLHAPITCNTNVPLVKDHLSCKTRDLLHHVFLRPLKYKF